MAVTKVQEQEKNADSLLKELWEQRDEENAKITQASWDWEEMNEKYRSQVAEARQEVREAEEKAR